MAVERAAKVSPGEEEEVTGQVSLSRSNAGDFKKLPMSARAWNALFRSDASKERVLRVIQLVVFFDFLGNSLMFSNSAYLFFPSEGLPQSDLDRKVGVFYQDAKDLGLGQAAAQNVGSALSTFASAIAGAMSPWLARWVGRKNVFLLYTIGAAAFYVLTYFSSEWNLLLYYLCRISTGLLAGSMTLANQFVYELYPDPMEAQKKAAGMMGLLAIAVAVGPLVGGLVGESNLFYPFLVAAGLELIAGFLVIMQVPNLKKKHALETESAETTAHEQVEKDISERKLKYEKRNFKKWMGVLWSARLLDRFGGNQMSHVVTLAMRSYDGFFFRNFSKIFLGYSVLIFIVIPVSMNMSKKFGLAVMPCITQTFGGIFTLCMGIAWLKSDSVELYLLFFFLQAFFNMNAMLVVTPTVVSIVPSDVKDLWMGYQSAATNVMSGVVPLVMGLVIDEETCDKEHCGHLSNSGSIAQGTFLFVTAAFGILSVIPYAALISQFPVPKPDDSVQKARDEEDDAQIEAFYQDKDPNRMRFVSMNKRSAVNRKLKADGGEPLEVPWRSFAEDKDELDRYVDIGRRDQSYLLDTWEHLIFDFESNPEKRPELQEYLRKTMSGMDARWTLEDKHQLGEWFGDYLEAAGWIKPKIFPRWWKAMLMASFPRIMDGSITFEKEGAAMDKFLENPVPVWRKMITLTSHLITLDKEMNTQAYESASRFTFSSFKPPNLF